MPVIPCNIGHFGFRTRRTCGEFKPTHPVSHHPERNRAVGWSTKGGLYSGLLLVGLESPSGKKFTVRDVERIVERVRVKQSGDPSSSFISQRGLYKHKKGGEIVHESSVRVILLHLTDETKAQFRRNVVKLAEEIARVLKQEEVIVEFQNRGISEEVLGVTP